MVNLDIINIWKGVMDENMDKFIIDKFGIIDLKKWLIEKSDFIKNAGSDYRRKLGRLSGLLGDKKYF